MISGIWVQICDGIRQSLHEIDCPIWMLTIACIDEQFQANYCSYLADQRMGSLQMVIRYALQTGLDSVFSEYIHRCSNAGCGRCA